MSDSRQSTFQTRIPVSQDEDLILAEYAVQYGHVERCLYADMRRSGLRMASFKNSYLLKYGLTARQFNAIARNLEGKISSIKELLPLRIQEKELAITKAKKVIAKSKNGNKIHQKKRRLHKLETELEALRKQRVSGDPRICFGSRKLFRKQFNLEINGYLPHSEWLADWRAKRSSQFFVLGSKDENTGCQGCVITANIDGTFNLKLRLLNSMRQHGKYLRFENVRFNYGADVIRQTLRCGQAISYRFLKDEKGWRVLVSTNLPEVKIISIRHAGAIGVDINADCLAVSEIDRFGNLAGTRVIPLVTYGKTQKQAEALIGDAVKEIVARAVGARKLIVVERLDFKKKRAELEAENPYKARMLSSFAYKKMLQSIHSAAYRSGIEVIEANPAYTSVIGKVNFSKRFGLSTHQGAALAIARRGSGFREHPTTAVACLATPKGDHVTFPLPARKAGKHVWSFWSDVEKSIKAVLAAHGRPPQGDPLMTRSLERKCPPFTARSRDANRRQHCSAGVMGGIPW